MDPFNLTCPKHNKSIILVCPQPSCKYNIFLCANCIHTDLEHINKHDPFTVYEDFLNTLRKSTSLEILNYSKSVEDQNLLGEKNKNINSYNRNSSEQHQRIVKIKDKLQEIYNNQCSELVNQLQGSFTSQSRNFQENYQRFDFELNANNRVEANLLNIDEISDKIKSFKGNMEQSLKFLGEVYNSHLMWQNSSPKFSNFGRNRKSYFR